MSEAPGSFLDSRGEWAHRAGGRRTTSRGVRPSALLAASFVDLFRGPMRYWALASVSVLMFVGALALLAFVVPFLSVVQTTSVLLAALFFAAFVATMLVLLLAALPFRGSHSWAAVRLVRGLEVPSAAWGRGFERMGGVIGLHLVLLVPLVATAFVSVHLTLASTALAGAAVGDPVFFVFLGLFLSAFLVPILLVEARWVLALVALVDQDLPVFEALAESRRMTRGCSGRILVMLACHAAAGLVALVVPPLLILAAAWHERGVALLYTHIHDGQGGTSATPVRERDWIESVVVRDD